MPVQSYFIFDFQTLIYQPSAEGTMSAGFDRGVQDANEHASKGIPAACFKMDNKHAFGVISPDCNETYVAGFMQGLLKKKLSLKAHHVVDGVFVARYEIEGECHPLLIAAASSVASPKNLMCIGAQINLVNQDTFYDIFTPEGREERIKVPDDACAFIHAVNSNPEKFEITNEGAFCAALCRAGVPHSNEPSCLNAMSELLAFVFDKPYLLLLSGVVGLLIATAVLSTFALSSTPIGTMTLLTAAGVGLFAGSGTYMVDPTSWCTTSPPRS